MKRDRVKDQFLEQIRKIPIIQVACEKAGIARSTVYRWRDEDPEFCKEFDKALAEGETFINEMSESQLISLIKDKSWSAISYWLSHRHPRFKPKLEISGEVTHRERREYTEEEKELFKEALRLAMPKDEKSENGTGQ